jgi:lauroyl/myristoyl acyltransferase
MQSSAHPAVVFHPYVDRLFRLGRADRSLWLERVGRALDSFPAIASRDRAALIRGIVICDLFNRLVFRVQTRYPQIARVAARLTPVVGPRNVFKDVPSDRPIVLGLMHFGPAHFVFAALQRFMPGRTVYALHAGGDHAAAAAAYLRSIGVIPLVSDEKSLRFLASAVAKDPNCVVVMGFDYLGTPGRVRMPFLGHSIAVNRGIAFLTDRFDALIVTAAGDVGRFGPRVTIGPSYEIDQSLGPRERQHDLMTRLFQALETRVLALPYVWSEWHNCGSATEESAAERH